MLFARPARGEGCWVRHVPVDRKSRPFGGRVRVYASGLRGVEGPEWGCGVPELGHWGTGGQTFDGLGFRVKGLGFGVHGLGVRRLVYPQTLGVRVIKKKTGEESDIRRMSRT